MSGPDGMEERQADLDEAFDLDFERIFVEEDEAELDDADLIALARRAIARNPTDPIVRLAIDGVLNGLAVGAMQ
jgi:hypothetical protein